MHKNIIIKIKQRFKMLNNGDHLEDLIKFKQLSRKYEMLDFDVMQYLKGKIANPKDYFPFLEEKFNRLATNMNKFAQEINYSPTHLAETY